MKLQSFSKANDLMQERRYGVDGRFVKDRTQSAETEVFEFWMN